MFALEPGELGQIVLEKHKGTESPPCCVVVAKSMRQQREYDAAYEAVWRRHEGDTSANVSQRLVDLFKANVLRIEGYQCEEPEDAFTQAGLEEVLGKLVSGRLVPYEQKKS
jgi:hypothetical protein